MVLPLETSRNYVITDFESCDGMKIEDENKEMADRAWVNVIRAYRRMGVAYMCGALEWCQPDPKTGYRRPHVQMVVRFKSAKMALYVATGRRNDVDFMIVPSA
ncbi:hypothetical protein T492DRAFT_847105 [Pavlovales sp. CCMP2436]|nr:hypothetical protein T492DRAFT_847105 [Pavlovales sp. CCMP2436]